jgi:hypothetical protein
MRFVMHPDMVYDYPIWMVGMLVVAGSAFGAILVELVVRSCVPRDFRRRHNDVGAAVFSVVGVTYAVLLAFVATLAWDGFNKAKATSYAEAAAIHDVYEASLGFGDPAAGAIRDGIAGYGRRVVAVEWPAQAQGHLAEGGAPLLDALTRNAMALHLSGAAEANQHALLLQAIQHLRDARQDRELAAQSGMPGIIWLVLILGGALTVAFVSFLEAPSARMQASMSAALAISGALVLLLIVALSQPFRGDFRVSTEPYDRVLREIP